MNPANVSIAWALCCAAVLLCLYVGSVCDAKAIRAVRAAAAPATVSPTSSQATVSTQAGDLPDMLTLQFVLSGQTVILNLTKDSNSTMSMMISQAGTMSQWSMPNGTTYATYTVDAATSIVVSVKTDANGVTTRTYCGSFTYMGQRWTLAPYNISAAMMMSTTAPTLVQIEGQTYQVMKSSFILVLPFAGEMLNNNKNTSISSSSCSSTTEPTVSFNLTHKQNYTVELLVVVDFAVYSRWFAISPETNATAKMNWAVQNIIFYYIHIINGVDQRYAAINEPDFSIRVQLAGIVIATTASDSPWTEGPDVLYGPGQTLAYTALTVFEAWINNCSQTQGFPTFDSAALFTANTMTVVNSTTGSSYSISGLANIASVCSYYRASVNYDSGEYGTTETCTHELGHNLGSYHDDPTYNNCSLATQYIMAAAPEQLDSADFTNPFNFSACSINYFRTYLASLLMNNQTCLLVNPSASPLNTNTNFTAAVGQKYTVDQQCQALLGFGPSSFYCAGGLNSNGICSQMQCWSQATMSCSANVVQRAADGTTCGSKQWCIDGVCVSNQNAPAAANTCIYGDYKGQFEVAISVYITCSTVATSQPWRCYDLYGETYSSDCCTTCTQIANNTNPGCQYGDRMPDWCSTQLNTWDCYDPDIQVRCCSTCNNYLLATSQRLASISSSITINYPGLVGGLLSTCQYGDRATFCSTIEPSQCYGSSNTCCEACAKLQTGTPGCIYGDQDDWCPSYIATYNIDCSTSSYLTQTCCSTCAQQAAAPKSTSTTTITTATTTATTTQSLTTKTTSASKTSPDPVCSDVSWCAQDIASFPGYCYNAMTMTSSCCASCKVYKTTVQGCEYGDQEPWCSTYVQGIADCQGSNAASCCKSCQPFLG